MSGRMFCQCCDCLDLFTAGDADLVQMAEGHRVVCIHGVTEVLDASPLSLP